MLLYHTKEGKTLPNIITLDSYNNVKDVTRGRQSDNLTKVIKKMKALPGQVYISPDGRSVLPTRTCYYYRVKR